MIEMNVADAQKSQENQIAIAFDIATVSTKSWPKLMAVETLTRVSPK